MASRWQNCGDDWVAAMRHGYHAPANTVAGLDRSTLFVLLSVEGNRPHSRSGIVLADYPQKKCGQKSANPQRHHFTRAPKDDCEKIFRRRRGTLRLSETIWDSSCVSGRLTSCRMIPARQI